MDMKVIMDYHHYIFPYIIKKYKIDLKEQRNRKVNDIVRFYTTAFSHLSGTGETNAISFLEMLQNRLEDEMKKIIRLKSIYYWYHLYRRLPPVATFNDENEATVFLYRHILECAFIKYGKPRSDDELIFSTSKRAVRIEDIAKGLFLEAIKEYGVEEANRNERVKVKGIYLGNFGKNEFLEIFVLERLAYEFWHTTMCLRRIYKGGVLMIHDDQYWVCNHSDTEFLMKSFDKRSSFQGLVCSDGITLVHQNIGLDSFFAPTYNVQQLSLLDYPEDLLFNIKMPDVIRNQFKPNFLWTPLSIDFYIKTHDYYKDAFRHEFGYSMESFAYTLYSILFIEIVECNNDDGSRAVNCMKRAYRHVASVEKLADEVILYYHSGTESGKIKFLLEKDEVIKVLNDLTLPETRDAVSLVTLGPRYLLFPAIDGDFALDLASILPIMMTKMHYLQVEREEKGHSFEDLLIDQLKRKKFDLWKCKEKLKHFDGTSKEIDISFVYKGFLFLGELKSNKMSLSFVKGDKNSLKFRKKKMENALSQADNKAMWLSNRAIGTNYRLPEDVKAIVPFVVSPFTEYIWRRASNLWLTDSIPRICTPSECEMLCSDDVIKQVATKPYLRYVLLEESYM